MPQYAPICDDVIVAHDADQLAAKARDLASALS